MNTPLTVEEAAAAANVSEKTILRALRGETEPRLVGSKVGTVWRIFPEDLEAWLIAQRPAAPAHKAARRTSNRPRQRGSLRALEQATGGSTR